ncbi:MAG: hypothetical protein ABJ013_01230 [Halioglobus sp.]
MLHSAATLAQTPTISVPPTGLPAEPLIGEEFCAQIDFTNSSGPVGYGPYVIGAAAEGVFGISVDFVDIPPKLETIGVFPESGQLIDPISGQTINGPVGGIAILARYPIGSATVGDPPLVLDLCGFVGPGAEIGVPLIVEFIPGFEFGDTPTGDNGAVLGAEVDTFVTPQLARITKTNSAPENERPPGPSFPFSYQYEVDISTRAKLDNVVVSDPLPANIQWTGDAITIASPLGIGCSLTSEPQLPDVPGGTVTVECTSVIGTDATNDLLVTVPVYISDTLDGSFDDKQAITNTATFDYLFQGSPEGGSDTSVVTAKHAAAQKVVSGSPIPGGTLTYEISFQVTDYPQRLRSGAIPFFIDDVIPDGLEFTQTVEMIIDGQVVPIVEQRLPLPDGRTQVTWDVAGALGGKMPNGSRGSITYTTQVLELYADGSPVQADDTLANSVQLGYTMDDFAGGNTGTDGSTAPIDITANTADKIISAPNPLPPELAPGEPITFRLSLDIPAGNTSNVIFDDILPLPVFDVQSVADVTVVAVSGAGFITAPSQNVSVPSANTVEVSFGDIVSNGGTLAVDLTATITDQPFADDLFLTNLLTATYENSNGDVISQTQAAAITVGAPDLIITKGVFSTDNGTAEIIPAPPATPRDGLVDGDAIGVDAFDNIEYVLTVENIGSQSAYAVRVFDPPVTGMTCQPLAPGDVINGLGESVSFSGNLFDPPGPTGGLVFGRVLGGNDDDPVGGGAPYSSDTFLITVTCTLEASVEPTQTLVNTAEVRWRSTQGSGTDFPAREDTASVTIAAPTITKSVIDAQPNYSGDLTSYHIGEIATYRIDITIPEGTSNNVRLQDVVNEGLAHVNVLSVTTSDDTAVATTVSGGFAGVETNAGYLDSGSGLTAPDRKLVFGPLNNDNGFGDITNADTDNTTAEIISVVYRAQVLNSLGNVNGTRLRNTAKWTWELPDGSRAEASGKADNIGVIEPDLLLNKVVTPDTGDGETPPLVSLELKHSGSSTAIAFGVSLTDTLPVDLRIERDGGGDGVFDLSECPSPPDSLTVDDPVLPAAETITAQWDEFDLADTCIIKFQTGFPAEPVAGREIVNCAQSQWQSLDAAPALGIPDMPPNNTLGVQRTGDSADVGGSANTYFEEDCATFKTLGVGISKRVLSTSEPQTDNIPGTPAGAESLTIGEEVTFELVVTLPQAEVLSLTVEDLLPQTLVTLEMLGGRVRNIGNNLAPVVNPPDITILDNSGDGVDDRISFDFGAVVYTPNSPLNEANRIRVEVDAKVLDVVQNANNDLDDNTGVVRFAVPLAGPQSDSSEATIEIVEPLLSIVKAADVSEVEAGTFLNYRLVVEHRPGSRVDAQNLSLSDVLPDELDLVDGSVIEGPFCTQSPALITESGNGFTVDWGSFALGASCEIDFQAVVSISAITGQVIDNTASIAWTSLDDANDADSRQYTSQDVWSVVVSAPGLDKEITATSIDDTIFTIGAPSHDLVIGETATFTIVADFPDGTTRNVRVEDILPSLSVALEFVPVNTKIIAVGSDLSLSALTLPYEDTPATDCAIARPECTQWVLGTVVNQPDTRGSPDPEDQVVFQVEMLVLDDPLNSGAPGQDKNLLNTAQLISPDAQLLATDSFNLVEPLLNIDKLTESGRFLEVVQPGATHEFTLNIAHDPDSTATAQTVFVSDTLNDQMLWVADSDVASDCPRLNINAPDPNDTGTVEFSFDKLPLDTQRCSITFPVKLTDTIPQPGIYPNIADLAWESAPGSAQSRQGSDSSRAELLVYSDQGTVIKQVTATSVPETGQGVIDDTIPGVTIGEIIEYEITVVFPEGASTGSVTLQDVFEPGKLEVIGGAIVFEGANVTTELPGTPVVTGNIIDIDYGLVVNVADMVNDENDSIIYRLQLRVLDDLSVQNADELINEVTVSGSAGFIFLSTTDSAAVEVLEPVLGISKQFEGVADAAATIRLDITNTGTSAAYDVTASDEFDTTLWVPGSLVPISVPSGFELQESDTGAITTVTLRAQNPATPPSAAEILSPGETYTAIFSMELANNGQPGVDSIVNTAEVIGTSLPGLDPAERVYSAIDDDILELPLLALTKSWSAPSNPVLPGDSITYTLTLENTGLADAFNVVFTDTPDPIGEFQNGSVVAAGGTVISGNTPGDSTIEATFSSIAAGETQEVEYEVMVPSPYPAGVLVPEELLNQAKVNTDEIVDLISDDPDVSGDANPTIVPIIADPLLLVNKNDGVILTRPGATIGYNIVYGNAGDQDATGVVLEETVPANTFFVASESTPGWVCSGSGQAGDVCRLDIDALSGATAGSAQFTVQVNDVVPSGVVSILNTVTVADDGLEFDPDETPNPSTDSDDESTPLLAAPDTLITKDDGGISVVPGQEYYFDITYQNTGNQDATGVVVTETVPDNVVFSAVASAPSVWSCPDGSAAGTSCTVLVGDLPANTGGALRFGLRVLSPAAAGVDLVSNTVTLEDDGSNALFAGTVEASDTTPIIAVPDLVIQKVTDATTVRVDDVLVYELSYANEGNQDATGAVVREIVPPGAVFSEADSSPGIWSCADQAPPGTVCTYPIGDFAVGTNGAVLFALRVTEIPDSRQVVNVAEINNDGSNGLDPTPGNNIATVINSFPPISIPVMDRMAIQLLILMLLAVGLLQVRRAQVARTR